MRAPDAMLGLHANFAKAQQRATEIDSRRPKVAGHALSAPKSVLGQCTFQGARLSVSEAPGAEANTGILQANIEMYPLIRFE